MAECWSPGLDTIRKRDRIRKQRDWTYAGIFEEKELRKKDILGLYICFESAERYGARWVVRD